nr:putative integron gene cassette protein [uncultured bacterium]
MNCPWFEPMFHGTSGFNECAIGGSADMRNSAVLLLLVGLLVSCSNPEKQKAWLVVEIEAPTLSFAVDAERGKTTIVSVVTQEFQAQGEVGEEDFSLVEDGSQRVRATLKFLVFSAPWRYLCVLAPSDTKMQTFGLADSASATIHGWTEWSRPDFVGSNTWDIMNEQLLEDRVSDIPELHYRVRYRVDEYEGPGK